MWYTQVDRHNDDADRIERQPLITIRSQSSPYRSAGVGGDPLAHRTKSQARQIPSVSACDGLSQLVVPIVSRIAAGDVDERGLTHWPPCLIVRSTW